MGSKTIENLGYEEVETGSELGGREEHRETREQAGPSRHLPGGSLGSSRTENR